MLDKCCGIKKKAEQGKGISVLNMAVLHRVVGVGLTTTLIMAQRHESVEEFSHTESWGMSVPGRGKTCAKPLRLVFAWQV